MDWDFYILALLEQSPNTPLSAKQVGRILDREMYREDANWARPYLDILVAKRRISSDTAGYWYQICEEQPRRAMAA